MQVTFLFNVGGLRRIIRLHLFKQEDDEYA
jgi:hypothetical protein